MVDNDTEPKWRINFDSFVSAAKRLKAAGKSLAVSDILDAAGLDQNEWTNAQAQAKRNAIDEIQELYDDVLERKMRGARGPKTIAQIAAEAPDDEPEETADEDPVEEIAASTILTNIIDNLAHYGDDKAGMVRTMRTVAMFYDLDLFEAGMDSLDRTLDRTKGEIAAAKRPYKRRGPKRKGARA